MSALTNLVSKRTLKDIESVNKSEALKAQGVFYSTDDSNMHHGKVLILGHEGTPYDCLLGLFTILIPNDYPMSPPKVEWKTSDGMTRFHPQLYIEGKVCLSILGTWSGPGWTSAMNVESILQNLQSLFVENPLAWEPGYEKGTLEDTRYKSYRDYVEHSCIQYMFMMLSSWVKTKENHPWEPFEDDIEPVLPKLFERLKAKVLLHKTEQTFTSVWGLKSGTPSTQLQTNWKKLHTMIPKIETAFLKVEKVE